MSLDLEAASFDNAKTYIKAYAPLAKRLSNETGIPASVIMGVALIESGHGASVNARLLNNHFGIVRAKELRKIRDNYASSHRVYDNAEESYKHFCRMIMRKKYYKGMRNHKDYKLWLLKMNAYKYSSAGLLWVSKILYAIRVHQLHKLDAQLGNKNKLWRSHHM